MTGRSGEIADALERRKVKVCCVQETRWKGEGTRMLRTKTGGKYMYKLFWKGCSEEVSGVGVIVSEEFIDKIIEVTRVNERLMMVKLIVGKCLMNVGQPMNHRQEGVKKRRIISGKQYGS